MSFTPLAFFGRNRFELAMPTGHLDLATIERLTSRAIWIALDAGKTLASLV
jgi:hypothetical protein